jgi:hypothetical protein
LFALVPNGSENVGYAGNCGFVNVQFLPAEGSSDHIGTSISRSINTVRFPGTVFSSVQQIPL